jgi:hypothetical protein
LGILEGLQPLEQLHGVILGKTSGPIPSEPVSQVNNCHDVNTVDDAALGRQIVRGLPTPHRKHRRHIMRTIDVLATKNRSGLACRFARLHDIEGCPPGIKRRHMCLRLDSQDASRSRDEVVDIEATEFDVWHGTPDVTATDGALDRVAREPLGP